MNIELAGRSYPVQVPGAADLEKLREHLDELRKVSGEFTHAQTLLEVSGSALRVLVASNKVLGVFNRNVPHRAVKAATAAELEAAIGVCVEATLKAHGLDVAGGLWRGRASAEMN